MAANQKRNFKNGTDFMFVLIGGIVAVCLLYHFVLRDVVQPIYFYWKWLLVQPPHLVSLVFPNFEGAALSLLGSVLGDWLPDSAKYIVHAFSPNAPAEMLAAAKEAGGVGFVDMMAAADIYSLTSLVVVAPAIVFYVNRLGKIRTFQTLHTQQSLLEVNVKEFSSIAPIVKRDITKEPLNVGPWAMPASPLFFCMKHKLICEEPDQSLVKEGEAIPSEALVPFRLSDVYSGISDDFDSEELKMSSLVPDPKSRYLRKNNVFRANHASGIFISQLGNKIIEGHFIGMLMRKSWDETAKNGKGGNYWRACFAGMLYAFGASMESRKKLALPTLDKFCYTLFDNGPITPDRFSFCDQKLVEKLWGGYGKNYGFCREVLPFATFENTFLMHLIGYAKKNGKISPSDFLWLRPVDRIMYFSIDQIGSRVGHVEALGPWSHYNAEKYEGFGLHLPYMHLAVQGCYNTLASEGWLPSKDINFNQKSMLDYWSENVDVRKKPSGEGWTDPVSDVGRWISEGRQNPAWNDLWKAARPLPAVVEQGFGQMFNDDEKEYFEKAYHKIAHDPRTPDSPPRCAISGQEVGREGLFLPQWNASVTREGGVLRLAGMVAYAPDAADARFGWKGEGTAHDKLVAHMERLGHSAEECEAVFALFRKIANAYGDVSSWKYDPSNTPLMDMREAVDDWNDKRVANAA